MMMKKNKNINILKLNGRIRGAHMRAHGFEYLYPNFIEYINLKQALSIPFINLYRNASPIINLKVTDITKISKLKNSIIYTKSIEDYEFFNIKINKFNYDILDKKGLLFSNGFYYAQKFNLKYLPSFTYRTLNPLLYDYNLDKTKLVYYIRPEVHNLNNIIQNCKDLNEKYNLYIYGPKLDVLNQFNYKFINTFEDIINNKIQYYFYDKYKFEALSNFSLECEIHNLKFIDTLDKEVQFLLPFKDKLKTYQLNYWRHHVKT